MKETAEITADMSCREAPATIYAKQGDYDTRFVRVHFRSGGRAFDMSDASSTEIRVLKPDGKITINRGVLEEDSAVYPLSQQSINVSGEGRAEFMLYDKKGYLISTVPSRLVIIAAPSGDMAAESTDEFAGMRDDLADIKDGFDDLNERMDSLEGRVNGMVSGSAFTSKFFYRAEGEFFAKVEKEEN